MSIEDAFSPGRRKFIQSIGTLAAGAAMLDAVVWSQDANAVVDRRQGADRVPARRARW